MHKNKEKKIKIAILHFVPGLTLGGAERVLQNLVDFKKNLQFLPETKNNKLLNDNLHNFVSQTEHHIVCLCQHQQNLANELRKNGVRVTFLHLNSPLKIWYKFPQGILNIIGKYHIVHGWLYHGTVAAMIYSKITTTPAILSFHSTNIEKLYSGNLIKQLVIKTARWLSKFAKSIVYCAISSLNEHKKNGFINYNSITISNGIDTEKFKNTKKKHNSLRWARNNNNKTPIIIGMPARWDKQKDHDNILHALSIARQSDKNLYLILCGVNITSDNQNLVQLITKYNLKRQVCLAGCRKDMVKIYSHIDILVLASAYGEAMPMCLLEAMSCNIPVISTDVGDSAKIIDDPNWVVPPKKPRLLAKTILNLINLNEISLKKIISHNRKRMCSKYCIINTNTKYYQEYKRIYLNNLAK